MNPFLLFNRLLLSWLKPNSPSYLIYFVTRQCNAHCQMCFYWRKMEALKAEPELTPEETKKIAPHLPPLIQLTISGGEPFLRPDLMELLKPMIEKTKPFFLSIPTNGILTEIIIQTTEKFCTQFPWLQINLELSLDGIGEKHDQIRGRKGTFENCLQTFQELKILQKFHPHLKLAILSVLSVYNQELILNLLPFIKSELKPDRMELMLVRGETREPEARTISLEKFKLASQWLKNNSISPQGWLNFFRKKLADQKRNLIIETLEKNQMIVPCVAGKKLLVLEPEGWVRPCEMLHLLHPDAPEKLGLKNLYLGSLREADYNLSKILQSPATKKILNLIETSHCYCTYECALLANLLFQPKQILRILS